MPEIIAMAKKVRACRKQQHKTQFEMASDMGVSIEALSLIERGAANPRLDTMQKIAAYMGITVSDLLKIEE